MSDDTPSSNLNLIRALAVVVALLLSAAQVPLFDFDCTEMPVLSAAGGVLTVLLVYATGEAVYRTATSPDIKYKLLAVTGVVIVGGLLVAALGFFTLFTHMCP